MSGVAYTTSPHVAKADMNPRTTDRVLNAKISIISKMKDKMEAISALEQIEYIFNLTSQQKWRLRSRIDKLEEEVKQEIKKTLF